MNPLLESTPTWLVRLTIVSAVLALLAAMALVWSRWGLVAVMAKDFVQYCF